MLLTPTVFLLLVSPKVHINFRHLMVITSTYPGILVNQFVINDRVIFTPFALQTRIAVFRRGLIRSKQFAIYTFFSLWFFESEFAKWVTVCFTPLCCCYECCISVKILCPSTFQYFFPPKPVNTQGNWKVNQIQLFCWQPSVSYH